MAAQRDGQGLTAAQREFFPALFAGNQGLIEFRALPSKARVFCRIGDEVPIARFLAVHHAENVYFGVATRINATGGSLKNCGALPALFVDLDFKQSSEPEARARLQAYPLTPSFVVSSGGGLHAYWLLREPVDLQIGAARARNLLRRLALHLDADLSAAEPARVLRVPDTYNFKYTPPRRVELHHA